MDREEKEENNTPSSESMTVDSNLEDLGNSLNSGFKLDCSKREAAVEYNRIVIPENVTSEEQDIHNFLENLNVNQVNIKETN